MVGLAEGMLPTYVSGALAISWAELNTQLKAAPITHSEKAGI